MTATVQEIAALIEEEFGLTGMECNSPIFSSGILDSLDVLRLIAALERQYKITVSPISVTLEMFDSLNGICSVVNTNIK